MAGSTTGSPAPSTLKKCKSITLSAPKELKKQKSVDGPFSGLDLDPRGSDPLEDPDLWEPDPQLTDPPTDRAGYYEHSVVAVNIASASTSAMRAQGRQRANAGAVGEGVVGDAGDVGKVGMGVVGDAGVRRAGEGVTSETRAARGDVGDARDVGWREGG
ncbi:uncharacterized protein BXZ73DRAFT_75471 [Epithele typhae]|uniref:uncharacterized protein n=1 Tax=Epithele typhae TaxID=378194 RepID=UPI002007B193|nr:uncharacterized protein BXZ73DRAFT_75471 [Epithele typhae]KAH9940347.1 hypothetical protein BXZ73DRAFT_75471 [Epithele typhae]